MSIGKTTFALNKGEYSDKLGRIISNHRANSRIIGEPREFILRSCRLTEQWLKQSSDPEVLVYLRNIDIAGGHKVKMLSLEVGGSRQPVSKSKLIDAIYPVKQIRTTASLEEKHFNAVKASMRNAVSQQLKDFRAAAELPTTCYLTGKQLLKGNRTDVDHVGHSFAELADSFLVSKSLRYTDIVLVGPPTGKKFKDSALWGEWQFFHEVRAEFALVCASANRRKGCGNYETPAELYGSFAKEDPEDLALDF
jgi:hypothetical protein